MKRVPIIFNLVETDFQERCRKAIISDARKFSLFQFVFSLLNPKLRTIVIVGDARKVEFLLIGFFASSTVIVDDGAFSVAILRSKSLKDWLLDWKRRALFRIITTLRRNNMNFYSIFVDRDIIHSGFNFYPLEVKIDVKSTVRSRHPLFLGQPLIEMGIVNVEYYNNLLQKVAGNHKTVYYYPHRNECDNRGKVYPSNFIKVERKEDVLDYLMNITHPVYYGFYSTALFVLANVLDDEVFSLRLENDMISAKHRDSVNSIYADIFEAKIAQFVQ